MADQDIGGIASEAFLDYVLKCGILLLATDADRDKLEEFLAESNARTAVDTFAKGEDSTFILEYTTPSSKGKAADDEKKQSAPAASTEATTKFDVFSEIPPSVFENKDEEVERKYLLFIKAMDLGPLKDDEPMQSQILISRFVPSQPFQAMLPYIRHTFVPIATLRAQREEKQQSSGGASRGLLNQNRPEQQASATRGILDKLRELELKLLESQDEARLPDIHLEPISEISKWLETLNDTDKQAIIDSHIKGKAIDIEVPDYLKEPKVLNTVLKRVRLWKDDITSVIRRNRASQGRLNTVQQEIKFWKAKMSAIEQVEAELQTEGVCASTLVLMKNNFVVQARAFLNQVEIKESKKEVQLHNEVLSTFPIRVLVTSNSVQDIIKAINEIFQHLDAFKNKNNYPIERIAILARAAARDVSNQLRDVLSRDIMIMKYSLFVQRTSSTERLFHNFQNKYTKLRSDLRQRELLNRQRNFSGPWHREQETDLNHLQKRVESIKKIRKGHAEIFKVIDSTFASSTDKETLQEEINKISEAYNVFRKLDVLKAPNFEWEQAVQEYETKIQEVENEIQGMIRRAMESASDPREMFRVCEKYNKLFVRDRIRNAVWEFQEELLKNVAEEIKQLQLRYRKRYSKIPASRLSLLRDIPQVSGEVIWCRQLKRQLDQNEKRLEAVLGDNWKNRSNAKELAEQMNSFAKKLDPMILVKQWENEAKSLPNFDDQAPIFKIDRGVNKGLSLSVAFDENYVKLFKEVRCLLSLGIRIDISLRLSCIDVKQKYPIAVKLKEAVSIFTRTCIEIDQYASQSVGGGDLPMIEMKGGDEESEDALNADANKTMLSQLPTLVDQYKYQCQQQILEGAKHRWQNHEKQLNKYVASLSKATIALQDKTQKGYDLSYATDKILQELLICPLMKETMTEKIERLQEVVNKLDDGGFWGVPYWTAVLNEKLERILLRRCDEILDGWLRTLDEDWDIMKSRMQSDEEDEENGAGSANLFLRKEPIKHTIKINNNLLQVQPPINDAKMLLGQDLQSLLAMVVEQPRPKSDMMNQDDDDDDEEAAKARNTFKSILNNINTEKIIECYRKIEELTFAATEYANTWLSYQALYDMDLNTVFEELGDDVGKWRKLLIDMKSSAGSFDSTDAEKSFGPIVIHYGSVRAKVDEKYRNFRQQTFKALKNRLGDLLRDFHQKATRGKHELEETSFDTSTTKEIVSAITSLQNLREESAKWDELWTECEAAEKLLQNNRYGLGATWMYASRVRGVLNDFFQVLNMRWNSLKQEAEAIYSKLEARNDQIVDLVSKLEERWHAEKPTGGWASTWTDEEVVEWLKEYESGILRPIIENFRSKSADGRTLYALSRLDGPRLRQSLVRMLEINNEVQQNNLVAAMQTLLFTHADVHSKLSQFDKSIKQIEESYAEIKIAKTAMKVVVEAMPGDDAGQVESMIDSIKKEMEGLSEVHRALTVQWEELQKIGKQQFMRLDTRELGKTLRAMEEELAKLPTKMKTYQVYHKFIEILKTKKKMNKNILGDLTAGGIENPILRQKHWRELFQLLGIKKANANQLTVEDLWSINLLKYINEIREICLVAQGENALENFLAELQEKWQGTLFELVDYKGKCSLVKNWNDLMADVADALSDVMSMKQSPYYKSFERDAISWEEKLNSATAIFDVMVDVQRRWVYLQGVFTNSEDVKRQLGGFYQKFKAFDREFLQLMKGIKAEPLVDRWVRPEEGLLGKLEANQNTLNQIQKALNEYLESQRAQFARFYFIGDDDLLEIIGNARDPIQMNRHLSKMFAGITQLKLSPDNESVVIGMMSREGEYVLFKEPIDVNKIPKIQEWLTAVETQMRVSLAYLLGEAIETMPPPSKADEYFQWCRKFPAQVALLATQVRWSEAVEAGLKKLSQDQSDEAHQGMQEILQRILDTLVILADRVLTKISAAIRKLYEQLITECVYQRDVTRTLIQDRICSERDFKWLYRMRFYWNKAEQDVVKKLEIRISRAKFYYGFEYFGATERLVQTPLTDKAYLTLCEALHAKLGGNPFGPAGTGKTESVKALGAQLGRFVLVFCCDETFDFAAMSRIFIGLCQCGAWGCFDEFNRLEEKILSAVSQQIQTIQIGLKTAAPTILIREQPVKLNQNMGCFVTMNPGYAGRSPLPDNLVQLFRGMAMIKPNRVLIAQVMLFSQGFASAELLSSKIVLLFELCDDQLSKQSHYDFGLRALKSVLRSAGNLKRSEQLLKRAALAGGGGADKKDDNEPDGDDQKDGAAPPGGNQLMSAKEEETILIRSLMSTVVPKLVMNDKFLFDSLLDSAFPGADIQGFKEEKLKAAIKEVAKESYLRVDEAWLVKLMQLHTIQNITHGVMLVGPSGAGKTAARNTLLAAMEKVDGVSSRQYEINPKAISKEQLYGVLDATTLEWTDGVFTSTLRMIIDNVRGESNKRHWIVFDGDVDPEWAENLNSVLDDNKMLTLPNGERLSLTPNIRIIFETPTLFYATPATVSRCGMVWFSNECVTTEMLFDHMLNELQHTPIFQQPNRPYKDWEDVCGELTDFVRPYFMDSGSFVLKVLEYAEKQVHVMKFTRTKAIFTLFSQMRGGITNILEYNENTEYPLQEEAMKAYFGKYLVFAMLWSFGGPMKLELRYEFGKEIININGYMDTHIEMPEGELLIDYEVSIEDQSWVPWSNRVSNPELEPQKIKDPTVVIGTIDTIRHEAVIGAWLNDLKPVILCGPPGSGKSMTLSAVLRANPQYEMITLNFSSTAGTELIFKAFEQYCKIERKNQGHVLRPTFQNKILVIFCDEINLPAEDLYGTQSIITFVRQLIVSQGYWHPVNKNWIQLENIQFVGACNPPTDAGRVILSPRFLNHCPLILVDFPGRESLLEIYGSFIRALLKLTPSIRQMADNVTTAMVDVYQNSQKRFNTDIQAHYVYSPRELSRWTRAMYRALEFLEDVGGTTAEEIIRLWAHEALRLFSDRLVDIEERKWTRDMIREVANNLFSGCDLEKALAEPILYSDYLSKNYVSVDKHALKDYILQRLKVFNEEELDVQLVIYDELLDHILRIDRVLRQPLGHLLMVGASGAGKTVFSRFVSWLNGMNTFQLKVHKDYGAEDFDADLRIVLIQSGVEQQKITFIFDESNILDTAFLERMNALLASGEVPGLFEDAEYMQLIMKLREAARKDGLIIDTEEELFSMFTTQVQNNLHIVFTMNPAGGDFSDRAATSPALFNRCVINWWGTWPQDALLQVAAEFTESCDLNIGVPPEMRTEPPEQKGDDDEAMQKELSGVHLSVSQTIVQFHQMVEKVMEYLANNMVRSTFVTPRHYLDLIHHFVALFEEKRTQLEEQQKHLNTGLKALRETEEEVSRRQVELDAQSKELNEQQANAKKTLEQMMEAEKDASKKKEEAIRVSGEVEVEMKQIAERTDQVESELAEAKPALEAAQKAVSNINKKQLNEIKVLKKPPAPVETTMNAVATLMGKKVSSWKDVQKMLASNDFIPSILKFDTNAIKKKARETIMKKYMSDSEFTFERVNKASKVAGPLVLWVQSQVKFAHLLDSVEPMTNEIKQLKAKAEVKAKQAEELKKTVAELEKKIEEYKAEYQRMVQKITELKNEMAVVEESMARAKKLLMDLSDENSRWAAETENFQKQLSTLDGDCLLAAGFLTYIGFYNITFRQILIAKWKEILQENGLPFNENLEFLVYLSSPSERIEWKAAHLPEDDLCVENAIILKRFNRYPLVIDPSGQATAFLLANYKKQKIARTSFLDSAFTKNLESALRFGNALLIEDVENMDPILNPVLNKEYQTVGGRRLVKLANKDIDFSPTFTMFLVTRDPLSSFTPDLCSRVTFVNFSVTPSSLQSQCLNKILKMEAPDLEKSRNDQLRLQGEFKFQLRELEDKLLDALNSVTGNILDDANLMSTLEDLKMKAKVITEKAQETEKVLAEVEEASFFYTPFAKSCSKLYFSLENLANVHFLYQFDLRYFLQIIDEVLVNGRKNNLPELQALGDDKSDKKNRLLPLMKGLHRLTYIRTKRALKVNDHASWGMRVAQVFLDSHPDPEVNIKDEHLQYILKGKGFKDPQQVKGNVAKSLQLTQIGAQLLGALFTLSGFEQIRDDVENSVEEWAAYKGGPQEAKVPGDWNTGEAKNEYQRWLELMVIQKPFRPDQMIRSASKFVECVFDWNLAEFEANADSLRTIIEKQIDEDTPILMASTPGNDPSAKIDQVASEVFESGMARKYQSFALGSPKDYDRADNAITTATKKGTWVCLKNVHLSPEWLQSLEKRLHRLKKDPGFRLFMTMEIHPKVPVTLLRKSSIIIYEPPLGIKASLQRTFNTVDGERVDRAPEERSRLYILLSWLHAVILERLRFVPIGWSKGFEFSETDLLCAMDAMDEWIDRITKSRSNIDPNEIPWDAMHKMLVQYVYGGRVDNKYDTARLESFVEGLFCSEAFNEEFALASLCQADDDEHKQDEWSVGRLGYVRPSVNGSKIEREMLARIVQLDGARIKIVYLDKYLVIGRQRINLNSGENWIQQSDFRTQEICMNPTVIVPPKTKYQDIRKWVLETDEVLLSNPALVGLPPRAELLILATRANVMCRQLQSLQDVETGNAQEELNAILSRAKEAGDADDEVGAVPQWMKDLRDKSAKWLEEVPKNMKKLVEQSDSIKNPLFRFMRREFNIGAKVLQSINSGLNNLIQFVDGEIKATNDLRQLVNELSKENIPRRWNQYTMEPLGVGLWLIDFVRRIEQLNDIADVDYVSNPKPCRWLGGLFSPAGFIAATRQFVAQKNQWPLEQLILCVEIGESEWCENAFIFEGVTIYGAGYDPKTRCMILTEQTRTTLPPSRFIWRNDEIDQISKSRQWKSEAPKIVNVSIPVYLNATFKQLLFDVSLPVSSALPEEIWVQRSVSLSVWTN